MDRRKFLRRAGAFSLPLLGGVPGVRAAGASLFTSLLPPTSNKVLVLVQLAGGNDGLHTLIPTDQLGELQSLRSNIYMPPAGLQTLTPSLSMHSRMNGMKQMFDDGLLSIVQSVGYPNQNRSHFRSTDIWTTASDALEEVNTGWLGRHLEINYPGFPVDYPTTADPDPPAISMGNIANATCQGMVNNFSHTVDDPSDATELGAGGNTPLPNDNYGDEVEFLRVAIDQTNAYGIRIRDAAASGDTQATYPSGSKLATQLRNVVRLVSGGLGTQVYVVTMGGFDTHSGQSNGANDTGRHADLMQDLSSSLAAFQQDLAMTGLDDRVMGMTFSEFGRRIRSNGSNGTDHGTAAPLFVFGNCASGTILGDNVELDTSIDQFEGVPMQYDFRDIYGSLLVDWFEVAESDVRSLLYPGFVYLPVAGGCGSALPVDLVDFTATGREKTVDLNWRTERETNNDGFEIERGTDGRTFRRIGWVPATEAGNGGVRDYEMVDRDVDRGVLYYYRLKQKDLSGTEDYSPIRTARLTLGDLGRWSFSHAFPNPAVTETTVQVYAPSDGRVAWSVFNAAGQRLLNDSQTVYGRRDSQLTINVARLPAGAYTIRFTAGEGGKYETRKLIVR